MTTYCYRCRNCGTEFEADTTAPDMPYCCDEPDMVRDYRAEAVAIGPNVLVSKRSLENL